MNVPPSNTICDLSHLEAIVFVDHCLMGLSGIYTDDHERLANPEALPALIKAD